MAAGTSHPARKAKVAPAYGPTVNIAAQLPTITTITSMAPTAMAAFLSLFPRFVFGWCVTHQSRTLVRSAHNPNKARATITATTKASIPAAPLSWLARLPASLPLPASAAGSDG